MRADYFPDRKGEGPILVCTKKKKRKTVMVRVCSEAILRKLRGPVKD